MTQQTYLRSEALEPLKDIDRYLRTRTRIQLFDTPIDLSTYYTNIWRFNPGGMTMPNGPASPGYRLYYYYAPIGDNFEIHYSVDVSWYNIITKWLVHNIEPWQITHRSRLVSLAGRRLQVPELERRVTRAQENMKWLKKYQMPMNISEVIVRIIMDTYRELLVYDEAAITAYIDKHHLSSLGEKHNWGMAYSVQKDTWDVVINNILDLFDEVEKHPGMYNRITFNAGMRARANSIDSVQTSYNNMVMERSRIILFSPMLSIWNVTLSKEKKRVLYDKVLHEVIRIAADYWHVPEYTIHHPGFEKGELFVNFSKALLKGMNYQATDGAAWEASVGTILGDAFNFMLINLGGTMQIPSGTSTTSLNDSIGMIWLLFALIATQYIKVDAEEPEIFNNGDDLGLVGLRLVKNIPLIEVDPGDTKYNYLLGYSFWDPEWPRITGIKVSMDRAPKRLSLRIYDNEEQKPVKEQRDLKTVMAWVSMFKGWFGDKPLMYAIQKVPFDDYLAPQEMLEYMYSNLAYMKEFDPLSFAKEERIAEDTYADLLPRKVA